MNTVLQSARNFRLCELCACSRQAGINPGTTRLVVRSLTALKRNSKAPRIYFIIEDINPLPMSLQDSPGKSSQACLYDVISSIIPWTNSSVKCCPSPISSWIGTNMSVLASSYFRPIHAALTEPKHR